MNKDKVAQVTIRGLNKMTKTDVRKVTDWLEDQVAMLKARTAKGELWLVKRKEYAPLFRMGLMR